MNKTKHSKENKKLKGEIDRILKNISTCDELIKT